MHVAFNALSHISYISLSSINLNNEIEADLFYFTEGKEYVDTESVRRGKCKRIMENFWFTNR